jgi:hypothetical protein
MVVKLSLQIFEVNDISIANVAPNDSIFCLDLKRPACQSNRRFTAMFVLQVYGYYYNDNLITPLV